MIKTSTLRKIYAALLGFAILYWGASGLLAQYAQPAILMYHHVDGRAQEWKLSVSPESFERQMAFLKKRGYHVMDLREYVQSIKNKTRVPLKTVILTFDDGYDNNYTTAYPILKKYGLPATIFIQADGTGRDGYMTEAQLKELAHNGIALGSHTVHHGFLPDLSTDQLKSEIVDSKKNT